MANANSTPVSNKFIAAQDLLMEASHVAEFIQGITLNHDIHLKAGEVTGFYFVMRDLIDRINRADELLDQHRAGITTPTEEEVQA